MKEPSITLKLFAFLGVFPYPEKKTETGGASDLLRHLAARIHHDPFVSTVHG